MYDKLFLDDTNRMIDIVKMARDAGSELSKFGSDYRGTCPIHGGKDATSFSIYKHSDGNFHWRCFSTCDDGGDAIQFIMKLNNVSFKSAIEMARGNTVYDQERAKKAADFQAKKEQEDREAERLRLQEHIATYSKTSRYAEWRDNPEPWVDEEWYKRGITHNRRWYYGFGGCSDYRIGDKTYRTLTIPIWDYNIKLVNIRHRILSDEVAGRYRPDVPGIPAVPFMALPFLGFHVGKTNIIVEGEIKAAVLADLLDDDVTQVIGVPGKGMFSKLVEPLRGRNNIVIPDPDAIEETTVFAKAVRAKIVKLPMKVDDYILSRRITKDVMWQLMKGGRLPC